MASFSSMMTSLTGFGFGYFRDSRHAAHTFSQHDLFLKTTQPRFGFQYFVSVVMSPRGNELLAKYGLKEDFPSLFPLVKSVDIPGVSIDTERLNEYNRNRITHKKLVYEPIKMVFHDVVDGRCQKLWQMYYEYYFKDGLTYSGFGNGAVETNINMQSTTDSLPNPTSFVDKFGVNTDNIENDRYLIDRIEIVHVHGGTYNKTTIVNPLITAFSPGTHSYESNDIMDFTLTVDYEYIKYEILNKELSEDDKKRFEGGEFMELPSLAISALVSSAIRNVNPLLSSSNPLAQRVGRNLQTNIDSVVGAAISKPIRSSAASVLDGLSNISPTAARPTPTYTPTKKDFKPSTSSSSYLDVRRSQ